MRKQYFWALQLASELPHQTISVMHFRNTEERSNWLGLGTWRFAVSGSHPEVRRLKARLARGETLSFPVLISEQ